MVGELASAELPDSAAPSRLDDRGRLRMPADFQRYLGNLREKKLFVTTLDGSTVRIYPMAVWRQNREWLASQPDQDARDLLFLANDMGANTEMDPQGRILLHEKLRKTLGLENQALMLMPWVWRIDVYTDQAYQVRKDKAQEGQAEKLQRLELRGLK